MKKDYHYENYLRWAAFEIVMPLSYEEWEAAGAWDPIEEPPR